MKRIITGMLLFAMLLTTACASETTSDDSGNTTESTSAAAETTAAEVKPEPELPYTDYDGADFTYLISNPEGVYYSEIYVYAESENGDIVNDAVFRRNMQIEDRFDINITTVPYDTYDWAYASGLAKYVLADDASIDVASYMAATLSPLGIEGHLVDFNEISYVDLAAEYWSENAKNQLDIGGKVYIMPNDISMDNFSSAYFTYFNQRLVEDFGLTSPYTLFDENKWTLDSFIEMIRAVSSDLDGNGEMDENDLYGLLLGDYGDNSTFIHTVASAGIEYVTRDADGAISIAPLNAKIITIADKLYDVFKDGKNTLSYETLQKIADGISGSLYTYGRSLFANGQFLFVQNGVNVIPEFSNMADDFGIIPNPKFDENQDKYYASVDRLGLMFAVPISSPDIDMVGEIMEYSAWLSHDTLLPAYYEVNLKTKKSRDDRSNEMLDLVKNSMFYDTSIYLQLNIANIMSGAFDSQSITSTFESNKSSFQALLDKTLNNSN